MITYLLRSFFDLPDHLLNAKLNATATTIAKTKKSTILSITSPIFTDLSAHEVTIVSAIIPRISSIRAAPRIALPDFDERRPISLSVSTVILTEVAVRIIPIKMFCKVILVGKSLSLLKIVATPQPARSGTITPSNAIINDDLPVFLSSLISVSSPAQNIRTITPISETCLINSVSLRTPKHAGPKIRPARSAPTTCGSLTFFVTSPKIFVLSKIRASDNKYPYSITTSFPFTFQRRPTDNEKRNL